MSLSLEEPPAQPGALVMSRSLGSPPPYAADHIVGEGVPPSVGRDARCLLVQMSCFTDRGTEMLILLIHCSSNFAFTAPGLVGDSENHRTWPLPADLE